MTDQVEVVNGSQLKVSRSLFFLERFLVSFSMGVFALFPAFLVDIGYTEVFYGSLSSFGVVFAIGSILLVPIAYMRFGLKNSAPFGALMYAIGSFIVILNVSAGQPIEAVFYAAVAMQSIGWSVHFTTGSVCIAAVASEDTRAHNFMLYAAFSTLGLSCGPIFADLGITYAGLDSVGVFWLAVFASLLAFGVSIRAAGMVPDWSSVSIPNLLDTLDRLPRLVRSPVPVFLVLVFMCACIYTTLIHFQATFADANSLSHETFFLFWALGVVGSRFAFGAAIAGMPGSVTLSPLFVGLAVTLVVLSASAGNPLLYAIAALSLGVTYGLSYPIVQAQAVKFAPPELRTMTQVLFSLFYFFGLYAFPLVAGLVIVTITYPGLWITLGGIALAQAAIAFVTFRKASGAA
ncbi:MAG: hypothetical protein QNJ44_11145 [Rhodobacter sp.]|nr:hypothetical protein [Rhodobacter sp.]